MVENIIGRKFGKLTVTAKISISNKSRMYQCTCSCGKKLNVRYTTLVRGKKQSCGCDKPWDPFKKFMSVISRRDRAHVDFHVEYLWELYSKQGGKCYYTGVNMSFKKGTPYTISVDRIDSSKHYTKDNIVLTTVNVNYFKNTLNDADFMLLLEQIRAVDKSTIPYYKLLKNEI